MGSSSSSRESQCLDSIDPISWLKSKDANSDFIHHVDNTLNGLYNPVRIHPKLDIIIYGYLHKLIQNKNQIPHEIEMLCKSFIAQAKNNQNVSINDTQIRSYSKGSVHFENDTNIIYSSSDINQSIHDIDDISNCPQNLILTIDGDFEGTIKNKNKNAMIVLNVIGTFSGSVYRGW